MARSTYIYVVIRNAHAAGHEWVEDSIFGTFTVKYEAHDAVPAFDRIDYKLMRFRDGTTHPGVEIPWEDK